MALPDYRGGRTSREPVAMAAGVTWWPGPLFEAPRTDPALEKELVPLLDDKKEEVRVRAAAGCLRLEWIKSTPPKPAPKQRPKKQASSAATAGKK
jgi:hypothetical protein